MNNSSTPDCSSTFLPTIMDLPSNIALIMTVPIIVLGVTANLAVLFMLSTQKTRTNQEIYVFVLCFSSLLMIGPGLGTVIFRGWLTCPRSPRITISLLVMVLQVTAGVNVWLTCCISLDRFLIVYHHVNYISKETKRCVISKIAAVVLTHLLVGLFNNFIFYIPSLTSPPIVIDPFAASNSSTSVLMTFTLESIQVINSILNVARLIVDRIVPWLLIPTTYIAVLVLRNRQKSSIHHHPPASSTMSGPLGGAASVCVSEARQAAERRIRRSRSLVIGISLSVFLTLVPETVLDFANFASHLDLRSRAPAVGLVWYVPNIVDPLICIVSLSNLRRRVQKIAERLGCSKLKTNTTVNGSTHNK